MRPDTQQKIDALHEQIAALIKAEIAHSDRQNPGDNWIFKQVRHTRIEHFRLCPRDRSLFHFAEARIT